MASPHPEPPSTPPPPSPRTASALLSSDPLALLPPLPSPSDVLPLLDPSSDLPPGAKQTLADRTLLQAVSSLSNELLDVVLGPPGREWVDLECRDEEGSTPLVLASALGWEEGVRRLVDAGADVESQDAQGWTPLHWSSLSTHPSSPKIVTHLLSIGASPLTRSRLGRTPKDLVASPSAIPAARAGVGELLESAEEEACASVGSSPLKGFGAGAGSGFGSQGTMKWSEGLVVTEGGTVKPSGGRGVRQERKRRERTEKRERAMWDSARLMEFDWKLLRDTDDPEGDADPSSSLSPSDDADDSDEPPQPFLYTLCLPHQMLAFSPSELPQLLTHLIALPPVRAPRTRRSTPASALFLWIRYAHYFGDAEGEMAGEVFDGAVERIEEAVMANPDNLPLLAYWLHNITLWLFFLRADVGLREATAGEMQDMLEDLINEIYVFIIRVAEKKIDKALDPALLDHSPLPEFDDIRFDGEWRLMRALTKSTRSSQRSVSSRKYSNPVPARPASAILSDLFVPPGQQAAAAAGAEQRRPQSMVDLPQGEEEGGGAVIETAPDPKGITDVLSATLLVLQLYDINPGIVVQTFSQIFYWVGCELFNRVLMRKKYLCRSRAMQIRLNVSTLEDWAKMHRLPTAVVSAHFAPLSQLLQWLTCLSTLSDFSNLIATTQTLRALNPLQLRRAQRDYRYEAAPVAEPKMATECVEYLVQVAQMWELRSGELNGRGGAREGAEGERAEEEAENGIDPLFDTERSPADWVPPRGPEPAGELLDSRFMLPFSLPTDADLLVARSGMGDALFRPPRSSRAPSSTPSGAPSSPPSSRPSSRASWTTDRSFLSLSAPRPEPEVPDDVLASLDGAKGYDGRGLQRRLEKAVNSSGTGCIGRRALGRKSTLKAGQGQGQAGKPPWEREYAEMEFGDGELDGRRRSVEDPVTPTLGSGARGF